MREIPLTKGLVTRVDDDDWPTLSAYSWCASGKAGREYAVSRIAGRIVSMHRLLAGVPGLDVDHIDRDRLNNQRANLRACTRAENLDNTGSRGGTSKFKGVCLYRRDGTWSASRRGRCLGRFKTEEQAAEAYAAALAQESK